jgi:hypothetical protein
VNGRGEIGQRGAPPCDKVCLDSQAGQNQCYVAANTTGGAGYQHSAATKKSLERLEDHFIHCHQVTAWRERSLMIGC